MQFKRIRSLRLENGLTQGHVSKKINIPRSTYSNYETGSKVVPMDVLIKLADFYDVSLGFSTFLEQNVLVQEESFSTLKGIVIHRFFLIRKKNQFELQ